MAKKQTVYMYACVDCSRSEYQESDVKKLQCLKHFVCSKCFLNRYDAAADTKDGMVKCSICCDFNESPGIYMFVDNSNVWIEAKALQAKLKGFKTGEDPRVRIDIGRLTDVLADGRLIADGVLCGSEPPKADSVWKKIKERGWRVTTDKKDEWTGKERKVDSRIVVEIAGCAKKPIEERTTIVVVTGDKDMKPAIEAVMKEAHWTVEVCMWKHAISHDLSRFAKDNHTRFVIKHLDDFVDEVLFTEMEFDYKRTRHLVNEGGVVFSVTEKAFCEGGDYPKRIPMNSLFIQLERIALWPFQYSWFDGYKRGKTNYLVLLFGPDRKAKDRDQKARDFDIKQFVTNIELKMKQNRLPSIIKVQTYLQFSQHNYKQPVSAEIRKVDGALKQIGISVNNDEKALAGSDEIHVAGKLEPVVAPAYPSNDWKTPRRNFHSPRQMYSDPCPYKFNCIYGTRCYNKHTEAEKTNFRGRIEARGNSGRKIRPCKYFEKKPRSCSKSKDKCDYAHGSEDAWCPNCRSVGHFKDNCPNRSLSC